MFSSRTTLRFASLAFLLSSSSAAIAQNDTVLIAPEPDWIEQVPLAEVPDQPRGIVFLRRTQTEVRLTDEGQLSYSGNFVRLLHPTALQLGNVALTWDPAAGAPTFHRLRIHRDGEIIDVLESNQFEILRREDQLEAAWIDGLLTATLRVPDLRIGDELEMSFTVPSSNPTLPDRDFGILSLAADPAPGRVSLRLSWDDSSQAPSVRMTDDLEPFVTRTENAIAINADDAGPANPPRDAPPRYTWQRALEFSDFDSWPVISGRFHQLFAEAATLEDGSPLIAEAERIARNNPDDLSRARAALELVAQQIRYIYVGLNTGALTPMSADETWRRRYADCKGKTVMLLALLDQLGIEAEAVVVSNAGIDDGFGDMLPNPALFDHVLVRATIDGQQYWLDGTFPGVVRPSTEPLIDYTWVLPLAEGGADLERLPWQPDSVPQEISLYEIDARAGFDVPAQIRHTRISRGLEAFGEYVQFSAVTDAQLENALRNQLAG